METRFEVDKRQSHWVPRPSPAWLPYLTPLRTCANGGPGGSGLVSLICVGLCLFFTGCPARPAVPPPPSNRSSGPLEATPSEPVALEPLVMVVVDDEPLGEICKLEWQAETGANLEVRHIHHADLEQELGPCDIVLLPESALGDAIRRKLADIIPPSWTNDGAWQSDDVLLRDATELVKWGDDVRAVSLGSPFPMLLFRGDQFTSHHLTAPSNWNEYRQTLEILSEGAASDGVSLPGCEPLAPGHAAFTFLARVSPYVRDRSQASPYFGSHDLHPLIADPPYVRALTELIHSAQQNKQAEAWLTMTPRDAARAMWEGKASMAITWPHGAWWPPGETPLPSSGTIAVAELPGSKEYFDFRVNAWQTRESGELARVPLLGSSGRIATIPQDSKHKRAALRLLAWLTAPERKATISARSPATLMYRKSHLSDATPWLGPFAGGALGRQVSSLVAEVHQRELWLTYPRFSYADRYIGALDTAVRDAVAGKSPPAAALQSVAETWKKQTEEIGAEEQRKSYLQSLGLGGLAK